MKKKVIYEGEVWEMDVTNDSEQDGMVRIYKLEEDGPHKWKYVPRGTLGTYNYFWQFRDSFLHFLHNVTK